MGGLVGSRQAGLGRGHPPRAGADARLARGGARARRARIALELAERGFGTSVWIIAQHSRPDPGEASAALEQLLDELGSPERRPFAARLSRARPPASRRAAEPLLDALERHLPGSRDHADGDRRLRLRRRRRARLRRATAASCPRGREAARGRARLRAGGDRWRSRPGARDPDETGRCFEGQLRAGYSSPAARASPSRSASGSAPARALRRRGPAGLGRRADPDRVAARSAPPAPAASGARRAEPGDERAPLARASETLARRRRRPSSTLGRHRAHRHRSPARR